MSIEIIDEFICRAEIEVESDDEVEFTFNGLSCAIKSVNESVELSIEGEETLISDDIDEVYDFFVECLDIQRESVLDELEKELRGKFK